MVRLCIAEKLYRYRFVILRSGRVWAREMHKICFGRVRRKKILLWKEIVIKVVYLITLSEALTLRGSQLLHHLHLELLTHLILVRNSRRMLQLSLIFAIE